MRRKPRIFRIIFHTAAIVALALAACWIGQVAAIAPPFGLSWGDGNAPGRRGYALGIDHAIVFETLAGMKKMPGGVVIGAEVQRRSLLGFNYQRTELVAWTVGDQRVPGTGTYGTQVRITVSLLWPILILAAIETWCGSRLARQRRRERAENQQCVNCGYDLRATPDRCPECGHIAARSDAIRIV